MLAYSFFFSALEQFDLMDSFGPPVGGLNNLVLSLVSVGLFGYLVSITSYNAVNSRAFFAALCFLNFVRRLLSENLYAKKNTYFYYTVTLFGFVLVANLLGLIPYSVTATSYLVVTLFLSGTSFIGNLIVGLRAHSWRFFGFFVPAGTPPALIEALIVIEIISYIARLFSLAIRLFANMLAGHALLKILSSFVYLAFEANFCYNIFPIILNIVVLAVTALEVMIAFLQAYVFVVLSTIYTNEAINLH